MAELLPAIEIETAPKPDASVIWLHGLGDTGDGWSQVVPGLGLPKSMRVRFMFPHAPKMAVAINNGYVMPAWYDIREANLSERADRRRRAALAGPARGADGARERTRRRRCAHRARGLLARRRGCAVHGPAPSEAHRRDRRAFDLSHQRRRVGGGVVAPQTATCRSSWRTARTIPSCASRGRRRRATRSCEAGYHVEWHEYPMEHSAEMEEMAVLARPAPRCCPTAAMRAARDVRLDAMPSELDRDARLSATTTTAMA